MFFFKARYPEGTDMSPEEYILKVTQSFYALARVDILIGYHFWRIQDFDTHIPRIAMFWETQLLGRSIKTITPPLDLMGVHIPMNIHKGELARWLILFRKTLDEFSEYPELKSVWLERLVFFEKNFSRFLGF